MLIIVLLLLNLISIGALLVAIILLFPIIRGAPYLPSSNEAVQRIIAISDIKPGEKAVDLGSGDGRIVIAFAKAGAEAHGYEVNPFLVWLSKRNIQKAGLSGKAFIHWGDFWNKDLSTFSIVSVYGIERIMVNLEKKLRRELKAGAKVISNKFIFPTWPYVKKDGNIYLYKI
jgi:16S rRNA A1518/A1519 N6-dimethyltransferase RsmA/KsgA/DIM1 with predicted DNA glycosylase/AP lyase activity